MRTAISAEEREGIIQCRWTAILSTPQQIHVVILGKCVRLIANTNYKLESVINSVWRNDNSWKRFWDIAKKELPTDGHEETNYQGNDMGGILQCIGVVSYQYLLSYLQLVIPQTVSKMIYTIFDIRSFEFFFKALKLGSYYYMFLCWNTKNTDQELGRLTR